MKKSKLTPEEKEIIRHETQDDPLDGMKAVGCLGIGIILLAIFASVGAYLISQIR
jgi:hypothetical protein